MLYITALQFFQMKICSLYFQFWTIQNFNQGNSKKTPKVYIIHRFILAIKSDKISNQKEISTCAMVNPLKEPNY